MTAKEILAPLQTRLGMKCKDGGRHASNLHPQRKAARLLRLQKPRKETPKRSRV